MTFGTGFMTGNSTAHLHEIPGSSKASGSSRSINAARCEAAAIIFCCSEALSGGSSQRANALFFLGEWFPQWSIWTRVPAQQFSGGWSCWSLWLFLDPSDGSVWDLFQAFVDGILVVVNRAFRCTKSTPYRFSRCRALCFLERIKGSLREMTRNLAETPWKKTLLHMLWQSNVVGGHVHFR